MCVRARGKQGAVALLSRAGGIAHDALRWLDERGRSSVWLEHSTVTREVAGSSPVAPVVRRIAGRGAAGAVCPGGEIGRHAILRGWCRKASRFESVPGHVSICEEEGATRSVRDSK